jgi:hypothetical protein
MRAPRALGTVALFLAAAAARAETYPINETAQAGDCFHVRLDLKLSGELRVYKGGEPLPLKLEAVAAHEYPERVLSAGAAGLPEKAARHYETARATITVAGEKSERTLRPDRRLIVAQRYKDQPLVYSPAGALTRDELDLTASHFDSLCVTGLLPVKPVALGETWKVPSGVVQAACNFEGLADHDLTGKLEEVKDNVATFRITGKAAGIDLGAMVKVTVEATGRFDLAAKRLVALDWTQKDEREQGPASPAMATSSTVTLRRQAVEQPESLSDVALVSVPPEPTPPLSLTQLDFHDPKGRYALLHAREWHLVSQTETHTVLRLMERGDFVAQVTVTPWTPAGKGKHLSPEDFKDAMAATPGWQPEKELQAGEVPQDGGRWVYRLSVLGQLDGVDVLQNFYLIASPDGEQVVVTFSLNPKQADKLGARDLQFVGGLDVPAPQKQK